MRKNILVTGTPGREFSTGGAYFYTDVGTNMITFDGSEYIQVPAIPASIGTNDFHGYQHIMNVYNDQFSYYG